MAQAVAFLVGVGLLSLGGAACGLALLREGQGPPAAANPRQAAVF